MGTTIVGIKGMFTINSGEICGLFLVSYCNSILIFPERIAGSCTCCGTMVGGYTFKDKCSSKGC